MDADPLYGRDQVEVGVVVGVPKVFYSVSVKLADEVAHESVQLHLLLEVFELRVVVQVLPLVILLHLLEVQKTLGLVHTLKHEQLENPNGNRAVLLVLLAYQDRPELVNEVGAPMAQQFLVASQALIEHI